MSTRIDGPVVPPRPLDASKALPVASTIASTVASTIASTVAPHVVHPPADAVDARYAAYVQAAVLGGAPDVGALPRGGASFNALSVRASFVLVPPAHVVVGQILPTRGAQFAQRLHVPSWHEAEPAQLNTARLGLDGNYECTYAINLKGTHKPLVLMTVVADASGDFVAGNFWRTHHAEGAEMAARNAIDRDAPALIAQLHIAVPTSFQYAAPVLSSAQPRDGGGYHATYNLACARTGEVMTTATVRVTADGAFDASEGIGSWSHTNAFYARQDGTATARA